MDQTIIKSGVSSWVYDPTRSLIYIADDNSGTISTWSLAANRVVGALQVGHAIDTLAITLDGKFLVAGETSPVSMGDSGGVDAVDRVNLITQQVDRFTFPTVPHEGGVAHLAIAANNQVLISDWADTSAGTYPLHTFDAEAASPSFSTLPGLPAVQTGSFFFTTPLDHGLVLVTEANSSAAPLDLYASLTGEVTRLPALAAILGTDFNRGVGDVTPYSYVPVTPGASGLVALSPGNGAVYVLDTHFNLVANLTPLFLPDPSSHLAETITSVKFTDNGRQLFVWDQTTNKISVIDTQTWQRVATLDAPTGHGDNPPDFQQWGLMGFVNHDYGLVVDDRDALHVIDLQASLHINLSGTAGNDVENGGVGTDSLSGGGGNDTITGGLDGRDTLDGGAGDDFLVSGAGPVVMLGGDGADTLNALYNAAQVSGGPGNDFIELDGMSTLNPLSLKELDGGDGDDKFQIYVFPGQGLTIDGGAGHNTLEMIYFGYETTPIALHLNGDASGGAWVGAGLQTVTVLDHVANVLGSDAAETITAPGVIAGGGGDDFLVGSNPEVQDNPVTTMTLTGADTINGGTGDDTINGMAGVSYLRGDEGNDSIVGGGQFDDINGNMGNDTAHGNAGDDWVVGGKDNDMLFGDAGGDVVWGNLGNDTLDGGDGNDQVRGGQGDDSVSGGAGDDYVSGDRGNDTIAGGTGADLFHDSQDAGIDRVLDFHIAEGDRVMLDPGTTYSVSQVGPDTVIDMGLGNQMILVAVQVATLTPGWIFLG